MAGDMNASVVNCECKTCVLMYAHAFSIDMECQIPCHLAKVHNFASEHLLLTREKIILCSEDYIYICIIVYISQKFTWHRDSIFVIFIVNLDLD